MEYRPEALLFDMFGTVFDWRTTVVEALKSTFEQKLSSQTSLDNGMQIPTVPPQTIKTAQKIAEQEDFWPKFAQAWRNEYMKFTTTYLYRTSGTKVSYMGVEQDDDTSDKQGATLEKETTFTTIDVHHFNSLNDLLSSHNLGGFYSPQEMWKLSQIWHYLKAWDDSSAGVASLSKLVKVVTSLSNGNITLLNDLCKTSGVKFDLLLSSELFGTYKPDPKVYIGACKLLGYGVDVPTLLSDSNNGVTEEDRELERGKCAMVATHLDDLKAARKCGMRTIYVERPNEDSDEKKRTEKEAGWVDIWIEQGKDGFEDVAKQLEKLPTYK